jgi:hypothetical protein
MGNENPQAGSGRLVGWRIRRTVDQETAVERLALLSYPAALALHCSIFRRRRKIGAKGFEPSTSWSQTRRSAKLSYAPSDGGSYHLCILCTKAGCRILPGGGQQYLAHRAGGQPGESLRQPLKFVD